MKSKILKYTLLIGIFFSVTLQADTKVVLLGTGTPVPDYKRASAGTAVVYNGKAYLFDVGMGVVQRAIEASQKLGIKALFPTNIQKLFITHLHSDHYLDYPALAATVWWRRKNQQLEAWGPVGLKTVNKGYEIFLKEDLHNRLSGDTPIKDKTAWQVKIHEHAKGGWIVKDGDVKIEAFEVHHGHVHPSFGYKITTPDKTIVISGDTVYSPKLIEMAKGADILVHEVISEKTLSKLPKFWQKYHKSYHTTSTELAKIANIAKPKLLVLTHVIYYKKYRDSALKEIKALYKGKVVLGDDLDVF